MSYIPARHTWTIWKGATFHETLVLYRSDGVTPQDLSGYAADLTIRNQPGGTALLHLGTDNGGILLSEGTGQIEFVIDAATTAAITWTSGVYDFILSEPQQAGDSNALLYGAFRVQGI